MVAKSISLLITACWLGLACAASPASLSGGASTDYCRAVGEYAESVTQFVEDDRIHRSRTQADWKRAARQVVRVAPTSVELGWKWLLRQAAEYPSSTAPNLDAIITTVNRDALNQCGVSIAIIRELKIIALPAD